MKTVFHKLVREASEERLRQRIPEIIRTAGQECAVETMNEEAFHQALRAKLVEEAQEAAAATSEELVTELADLHEAMDALMAAYFTKLWLTGKLRLAVSSQRSAVSGQRSAVSGQRSAVSGQRQKRICRAI
ncbi:MAG: nucleoside triphosphate pyrophosphohydrolase [Tildeniella nuda ZEHNDER 1965/U140]|nr:nucleoside triphosphate pyrophosphohydrolase [Tildeniella nuda ZEHNDER 1965/U140]